MAVVAKSYAAGATKLPGHTDPKRPKDTIAAELSPGEAVLNAPAAQKLGTARIDALNKAGNASRHTDSHGKPLGDRTSGLHDAMAKHADRLHPRGKNG